LIRSKLFIFCLLAVSTWSVIGLSQSQQPPSKPAIPSTGPAQAAPPAAPTTPPDSTLPADAPVITIDGLCEVSLNGLSKSPTHSATTAKTAAGQRSAASHSDCKTQITRAQFEKLMKTVAAGAPPGMRRQIAARYVQFLTAANEGVRLGVDKDPDFSEQLAIMRLQLLAQDAERKLQAEASKVSDADIKAYYDQNPSAFEEVTLTRIFVPRPSTEATKDATKDQPAPDAKAIADNAHQQLASGAEPEKIQKTVYEQLKLTTDPPTTKFGAKRRGSLPPAHEQKIFALKSGETSDVIQDSFGSVIYKVDAREELPLDKVKEQVKAKLTQQRIEDARQKIMSASKADYNDAYFGPEPSGPKPGQAPAPPTIRPRAEGTPNSSPATGTNPAPTQSANPKK
jgi:parvulin-like peptidyl-prolyl isomerase